MPTKVPLINYLLDKLEATTEYLNNKIEDLATLNGQLDAENNDFANETDIYNALVT